MSVLDREARRAAQLAARAEWQPTKVVARQADRVTVGTWIERVPAQHGVKGIVVEAFVETVEHDWDAWRLGRHPVPAVRYTFAGDNQAVAVCIPASFTVQVRVADRTQQPT